MKRPLAVLFMVVAALGAGVGAATAAPASDAFTGAWVLDDGDGSSSYYLFGAPGSDGVRRFTLFDTYATFCEVDAQPGSGSALTARGTAVDDGSSISITVIAFHCANGAPGALQPPIYLSATNTNDGLDFGGGFVATRIGRS